MVVEFANVVGTVGAKGDVAPVVVLPNTDVNDGAETKADCGVVEDPSIALAEDVIVPKADCGAVEDPLIALDAGDAELKALCAGAADVKALCTCAGAPNALCVGPAVGAPNEDCPITDPCAGANANPDV